MANVYVLTIDGLEKVLDELIKVLENFSYEDHGHEISDVIGLLDALNDKISSIEKGAANGVASLGEDGKVPQSQLSGFVTDEEKERWNANEVVKGAFGSSGFTTEDGQLIPYGSAEDHKFYIDTFSFGLYFGYNGNFESVSKWIQLGETSTTAFRGDRGKIAYDHSKSAHAPSDAQKNVQTDWNENSTTSDAYLKNKPDSLPADGGNADTAEKLKTVRTIDGIEFDGSGNIKHIATCSTSASTTTKNVTITGFQLVNGATIAVKFTNGLLSGNNTLNVSGTGAKPIYYRGTNIKNNIQKNTILELTYNGSYWEIIGDPASQKTPYYALCSTASDTKGKSCSINNFSLETGAEIIVQFTYGISIDDATLKITSRLTDTAAKPIYYKNKPLLADAIQPNTTVKLVYTGTYWKVVGELLCTGTAVDFFNSHDLDDYTTPGRYVCHVTPGVEWENAPSGWLTSWLDVSVNQGTMTQVLTEYEGRYIYIRGYYQKWSAWRKITTAYA